MVYSQILFLSSAGSASRREGLVVVVVVVSADMVVIMEFFAVGRVSTKPEISREPLRAMMAWPNAMP